MKWLLGRSCKVCGRRSFRACGARAKDTSYLGGGAYYRWQKWNPCSARFPGGLDPDAGRIDADGGLDDMSDIIVSTEGGTETNDVTWGGYGDNPREAEALREAYKNGGIYGATFVTTSSLGEKRMPDD